MFQLILELNPNTDPNPCLVPVCVEGIIIFNVSGKGGAKIKEIREVTGASVQVFVCVCVVCLCVCVGIYVYTECSYYVCLCWLV